MKPRFGAGNPDLPGMDLRQGCTQRQSSLVTPEDCGARSVSDRATDAIHGFEQPFPSITLRESVSSPVAGSLHHDQPMCPRHADEIGCVECCERISTQHHDRFATDEPVQAVFVV